MAYIWQACVTFMAPSNKVLPTQHYNHVSLKVWLETKFPFIPIKF